MSCVSWRGVPRSALTSWRGPATPSRRHARIYLCLADAAEALAATYDRLADTREAYAREAGGTNPGEDVLVARRRADAERREAQRLRRAAEGPCDDEGRDRR